MLTQAFMEGSTAGAVWSVLCGRHSRVGELTAGTVRSVLCDRRSYSHRVSTLMDAFRFGKFHCGEWSEMKRRRGGSLPPSSGSGSPHVMEF